MTRDEIIATIRKNAEAIKAEGVTKLAIFGSRVRGDNRADSDLDVLVEVAPDASFSILNLIGAQHIIEDATGLQAQATMRRSIPPRFAERIADYILEVSEVQPTAGERIAQRQLMIFAERWPAKQRQVLQTI